MPYGEKLRAWKRIASGWLPPRSGPALFWRKWRAKGREPRQPLGAPIFQWPRTRFCRTRLTPRRSMGSIPGCTPPKRTLPPRNSLGKRRAGSSLLPEVTVGWRRQDLTPGAVDGPIFGFAWSLPFFDRRQASRKTANAGLEAARARLELIEREMTVSRGAASNNFARLSAALAETRQELSRSDRMLDGAEAAFRQGEAGVTDLLETHRSVTEAELAVLDLHEAALAAHRELERVAGSAGITAGLVPAAPERREPQP